MVSKVMVNLYYTSKRACREDCDKLGIDRRRVITLKNGHSCMAGFNVEGAPIFRSAVAMLRVNEELIAPVVQFLQHDDDESWF